MKTKRLIILAIISLILISNTVFAENINTSLKIEKAKSETKYLQNNQGTIEQEITKINSESGEATVSLTLNNKLTDSENNLKYENTEIFIIINENMVTNEIAFDNYKKYIDTLSSKVFEKNNNTKIGIVGMQGTVADTYNDEEGNLVIGENDEMDVEGDSNNAEIVSKLTNNKEELLKNLDNMNIEKKEFYHNMEATINLAKRSFSKEVNKILILLFDNVPNIANGIKQRVDYGGWTNLTAEEAIIKKHQDLVNKTKSEILSLKQENIEFIQFRPKETSFDQKWYSVDTGELIVNFDGSSYVNDLYGTIENPTYGKMYSLENENIEKVVTEYIYNDIMENTGKDMKNVEVKNYFSKEILNNFELKFENSKDIDITTLKENGYITWNIGELKNNESKKLEYKLKIKDMSNYELLNKAINIIEKIECKYTNYEQKELNETLTDSPTIKLVELKESNNNDNTNENNNKEDNTTAPGILPQTGENIIWVIGTSLIIILSIILYKAYKKNYDIN